MPAAPIRFQPEPSNLRIVRILLLLLVAVLLVPYVLTPLYRSGHPVSALMASAISAMRLAVGLLLSGTAAPLLITV